MQVFISWSKPASRKMAQILRDWLPEVIQQIEPWVSSEDIGKGRRWSAEIAQQLDATSQGLVCVTPGNMGEPWLNFEAGALAKFLGTSEVRPLLLGVATTEVTGPLSSFQMTLAHDREDMFKLVESLNNACETPLTSERLRRAFHRAWPDLEEKLQSVEVATEASAAAGAPPLAPTRSAEDMLREVLDRIRGVEREMTKLRPSPPPRAGLSAVLSSSSQRVSGSSSMRADTLRRLSVEDLLFSSFVKNGMPRPEVVGLDSDVLILALAASASPEDVEFALADVADVLFQEYGVSRVLVSVETARGARHAEFKLQQTAGGHTKVLRTEEPVSDDN